MHYFVLKKLEKTGFFVIAGVQEAYHVYVGTLVSPFIIYCTKRLLSSLAYMQLASNSVAALG